MNRSFKFFLYAYLVFAVIFLYNVITSYMAEGKIEWASVVLCVLAIFMFFFRMKFNKKFDNKD